MPRTVTKATSEISHTVPRTRALVGNLCAVLKQIQVSKSKGTRIKITSPSLPIYKTGAPEGPSSV